MTSVQPKYKDIKTKYLINEQLSKMPKEEAALLNRAMPEILGVSVSTWLRMRRALHDDRMQIGSIHLDLIAIHLSCHPDELKNYLPNRLRYDEIKLIVDRLERSEAAG